MKKSVLAALLLLLMQTAWSQDTINISPDLKLIRISANAFIHVSYESLPGYGRVPANGLIFTDGQRAFLFDTPWNDYLTEAMSF